MRALVSGRRLIVGFVAALLVAGTGLALAHGSGTPEGWTAAASGSPSDPSTPFAGPESFGAVPEMEWRKAHGLQRPSEADEVDFAAEGPAPWQADACREQGPETLSSTPFTARRSLLPMQGATSRRWQQRGALGLARPTRPAACASGGS
jgi:hypothetical protein